jgi:hypothetical protein
MERTDRRSASRVQLQASVNLKIEGEIFAADTDLRDVSLDGISISTAKKLPINNICDVEITITGPSSVLRLTGKGRILRQDSHGAAVKFTELDMDSYMYLKNIMIYNRVPINS